MIRLQSIKKGHHKAGKSFVLLFNRVSMYGPGHPFSVQAVEEFYRSICELLKTASPVVLMHSRGQFFLEDEPLDPSLNYFKMSSHFKKAGVSSIAVSQGLEKREIEEFVKVLLDVRSHPTADSMKAAAAARQITRIRINHVSYQKVTEDDEVVSKSAAAASVALGDELQASRNYQEALGMIAGRLLLDEIDQGLSLKALINDPPGFARRLVSRGAAGLSGEAGAGPGPATDMAGRLASLGRDVREAISGGSASSLTELAAALVKMRYELKEAVAAQKTLGVLPGPEEDARKEVEDLADAVLLELIKKEYDGGRTPIGRLAVVIQRIVTPAEDLQRLLPRIRESLLAQGMPVSDFSDLIRLLGQAVQSDELAEWVHQGAEAIGVDGAELLARWKADPIGMAKFLYLATEIDRQSGSRKPLSDILVDYIEGFTPKLLKPGPGPDKDSDGRFQQLASWLHSKVIEGLRAEGFEADLVAQVEARLQQRLDHSVASIRTELAAHQASLNTQVPQPGTLLQRLEDGLSEGQELKLVLKEVRAGSGEQRLDENDFSEILERIQIVMQRRRKTGMAISEAAFARETTFALLEKEISRAARYGTDLSAITLSVVEGGLPATGMEPPRPALDATAALLAETRQHLRSSDWLGTLDKALFVAVLPMTTAKEAHLTSRRLLKRVNSVPMGSGRVRPSAKIAGTVIHYDPRSMVNVDAFVRCARTEHAEMTHRLRNLKEFM